MKANNSLKRFQQRLGLIVFIALAVLTVVEYGISLAVTGPLLYLAGIALIKAGLIVAYFMRLPQLWQEGV